MKTKKRNPKNQYENALKEILEEGLDLLLEKQKAQ